MLSTHIIAKLGKSDIKLIRRDRFLISMFFLLIYLVCVIRFGLPALNEFIEQQDFSFTLREHYPMIIALATWLTGPSLIGIITAFLLLDEREDHTIHAMLVTPISLTSYVTYRVGQCALLSLLVTPLMVYAIGIEVPSWHQALPLSIGAALTGPIYALFFATIAENKVQALAIMKFANFGAFAILFGWFVAEPVQWLFGIFPPFLISKAYWMALEGNPLWWIALIPGILGQLALTALLARSFDRVAHR